MSNEGISPRNRVRATFWQIWESASRPDSSITEPGQAQRARLLAGLSLLIFVSSVMSLIFTAITAGPQQAFSETFLASVVLIVVSLLAYVFSRTPFITAGSVVFVIGISVSAYALAFASTTSASVALYSRLLPALVIGAALFTTWGLVALTLVNAVIISILPIYLLGYGPMQAGGDIWNLVTTGFLLALLVAARNLTERARLADLQKANADLHVLQTELEKRVEERTADLGIANQETQRRSEELQAITEISQTIALVQNLDDLLPLITGLISERFGYYHVGIFLADEAHEYAVLQAANSRGGQKMLARQHRLKLGSTSIVGYVTQTGRPRVAMDVGEDVSYFDNPDLPDTHSEVALPLKVGERVIGALDVQSTETNAFAEENLEILTTLANQVAIAIQNARLYNETRLALSEARRTSGRSLLTTPITVAGFTYNSNGTIEPASTVQTNDINPAIISGQTIVQDAVSSDMASTMQVPVKIRDRIIGVLHIESAVPNRRWNEDEIALAQTVSERAAFALENARLFESATRRAEQEETIARVTSRIGESRDFNRILQTTIQELSQSLNTDRAYIQLVTTNGDKDA